MTTQTVTIKNGIIVLPVKIRQTWKDIDVQLQTDNDTIVIKRLTPPSLTLTEMMDQFRQAAKRAKITKKDVADVIKQVRGNAYSK